MHSVVIVGSGFSGLGMAIALKKAGRQFAGFTVVLAVKIETPINLSLHTAVIDLLHSRHQGAPFPDETYRALFAPFL